MGMTRSPRNKTLFLSADESHRLAGKLRHQLPDSVLDEMPQDIIWGNWEDWVEVLPPRQVDLLFLDPPYNLTKTFNQYKFRRQDLAAYTAWLDYLLSKVKVLLKPDASIYICADWYSSISVFQAASRHFIVRNRITWERDKGRGSKRNWKNNSEDIWFCTASDRYTFNADDVKLRRKVLAPYRVNGRPKDWLPTEDGGVRDTYPSNLWTDITIPFWSMSENTSHPTQKSEKLLAKVILASTRPGDLVFDPMAGSGTTLVVAKKLGRRYLGIEIDQSYCLMAAKRLELADQNPGIQGYADGVFWERNSGRLYCKDSGKRGGR